MILHSTTIDYQKKIAITLTLRNLTLVFVIFVSLIFTIGSARADLTEYTYFREFSFGGDLGMVTTTLTFFADPDKDPSPIPDFTNSLLNFSWNIGRSQTMPGIDITPAPCPSGCQFDLTDPTSDSNLNFNLGSGTSYTIGSQKILLTELRVGPTEGNRPLLFLGNPGLAPPLQASALGIKASWTAIPAGSFPRPTQSILEPDTAWLMLTGLLGLGTYVYRGRSNRRLFNNTE
ncbi:MAG: hypothetical protein MRJ67_08910 [Nitrospirales bacterium]|nr:hypothetical protein [Nitrospirales bacterium]MDR4481912.1 hypothetical protein [Nitrospirales bacterium]